MTTLNKQTLGYLNQEELMDQLVAGTRLTVDDTCINTSNDWVSEMLLFYPTSVSNGEMCSSWVTGHFYLLLPWIFLYSAIAAILHMSGTPSKLNGAGTMKSGEECHWSFVHPLSFWYITFLDFTLLKFFLSFLS